MIRTVKFNGVGGGSNQVMPVTIYTKGKPVKISYLKVGDTINVEDREYVKFLNSNGSLKSALSVEGITTGSTLVYHGVITTGTSLVVTFAALPDKAYEILLDNTNYQVTAKSTTGFTIALKSGGTSATTVNYAVVK